MENHQLETTHFQWPFLIAMLGFPTWHGVQKEIFEASKNKYLGHHSKNKYIQGIKTNIFIFPALVLSLGPLIPSLFSSPLPWSPGPLVPWSPCPLVLPSFGDSTALKHFPQAKASPKRSLNQSSPGPKLNLNQPQIIFQQTLHKP